MRAVLLAALRFSLSLGVFSTGWRLFRALDRTYRVPEGRRERAAALAYLAAAVIPPADAFQGAMAAFLWGSLALAATCDHYTRTVPDLAFVPAAVSGLGLLAASGVSGNIWTELGVFFLLQLILFRRFYGGADGIAFGVCALYLAAGGRGLVWHLGLMALSFVLLALVQAARRNINRRGNLKAPVPLVPYIAAAMLAMEGIQNIIFQ